MLSMGRIEARVALSEARAEDALDSEAASRLNPSPQI
jgi:hypothetical protein